MSDQPARAEPSPPGRWLSLGPASTLLGVDPDTLRRWADDGRVQAWTTPGGHRRFERRSLERLAADRGGGPITPLATLGASPARVTRAYRANYASAGAPLADEADRDAFRRDGRLLVGRLLAYLDADGDAAARAAAEADATAIVDDLATRLAASGSDLTGSVAQFVAARRPFLAELAGLGRRRSLDPARLGALYEDASGLLDRLLLRFIDAHRAASGAVDR